MSINPFALSRCFDFERINASWIKVLSKSHGMRYKNIARKVPSRKLPSQIHFDYDEKQPSLQWLCMRYDLICAMF